MARFTQFAVKATQEAMADSGLDMTKEDAYRVGTCIGSGVGSLQELENAYGTILTKGTTSCKSIRSSYDDQQHRSR